MSTNKLQTPDRRLIERLQRAGGGDLTKCYQCAACSAVCKLTPENRPFPRKEMILAQWGQRDRLAADPDVWLCHQCNDCTVHCPRGARPGDVMAAIRNYSFEYYAFPGFMGRLLATPSGLPILLLIPILILGLLAHWGEIAAFTGHVHFYNFIHNGNLEMLFIGGNAFIFLLAVVGLARFYNDMARTWGVKPTMGFIPAAIVTALEIGRHNRFSSCDEGGYRKLAHLLVFYGFLGAAATAGLALMRMLYLHYLDPQHIALNVIPAVTVFPPLYWFDPPIKILGNASGLGMIVGLTIMLNRHSSDSESSGIILYPQKIFLCSIYIVAVTGLAIQFLRMGELPMLAYGFYFIHLIFVFFLLWYAPYSQFGHLFYRTLAMVFARSVNRLPQGMG